jgi:hypothetical protein
VVLVNVLEHFEDDAAAVSHVARVLKPGGVAVIEVPAGPQLFDVYDKYLQHFRRYQLADLCRLVERAGLQVIENLMGNGCRGTAGGPDEISLRHPIVIVALGPHPLTKLRYASRWKVLDTGSRMWQYRVDRRLRCRN